MPPETPSFPSTAVTWMFVLYPPTFSPHHPSFLGESSTPAPQGSWRRLQRRAWPVAQLQSRVQQEQEESARSCQLPQARVMGHRPLACPHPWPALARPWGSGLRGVAFTPGLPTPLSLGILSPPSSFPPSLQRLQDGGLLWDSEAWPRQGCHVPSCFLPCRLS